MRTPSPRLAATTAIVASQVRLSMRATVIPGAESERDRHPNGEARRQDSEGAEQQRCDRRHSGLDDRRLLPRDAPEVGQREELTFSDAVRKGVCVDVREPEHAGSEDDEGCDAPRRLRVCLRPGHENGEHEDRSVDEPAEPFAHRGTAEATDLAQPQFLGHTSIIEVASAV